MRRSDLALSVLILAIAAITTGCASHDWRAYGFDSTHFSKQPSESVLNASTAATLHQNFNFVIPASDVTPPGSTSFTASPSVYNNTVSASYVFNSHLLVDAYFGYSRIDMYSNQPYRDQNLGSTLLAIPGLSTAGLPKSKQLQYGGLTTRRPLRRPRQAASGPAEPTILPDGRT